MEEQNLNKRRSGGAKSPRYPVISLKGAISKVEKVYHKEYQVPCSRAAIIENMGYNGESGTSARALSALKEYGLLEGRGDRMRVSDLAVAIIAHEPGTPEWAKAIREAARTPRLFRELDERFDNGRGSDANIRSYLMTHNFIPRGVERAIRAYRQTKDFLEAEGVDAFHDDSSDNDPSGGVIGGGVVVDTVPKDTHNHTQQEQAVLNSRRMVYALDEGDVKIEYPSNMAAESVEELEQFISLFLNKIKNKFGNKAMITVESIQEIIDVAEVGHAINREREVKGLTHDDLASQAGIDPQDVENMETMNEDESKQGTIDWSKVILVLGALGIGYLALKSAKK